MSIPKTRIGIYSKYSFYTQLIDKNDENDSIKECGLRFYVRKHGGKRKISEIEWTIRYDLFYDAIRLILANLLDKDEVVDEIFEDESLGFDDITSLRFAPIPYISDEDGHLYFSQQSNDTESVNNFHLIRVGDPKKLKREIAFGIINELKVGYEFIDTNVVPETARIPDTRME